MIGITLSYDCGRISGDFARNAPPMCYHKYVNWADAR